MQNKILLNWNIPSKAAPECLFPLVEREEKFRFTNFIFLLRFDRFDECEIIRARYLNRNIRCWLCVLEMDCWPNRVRTPNDICLNGIKLSRNARQTGYRNMLAYMDGIEDTHDYYEWMCSNRSLKTIIWAALRAAYVRNIFHRHISRPSEKHE